MAKIPFSMREGLNPHTNGFDLEEMNGLFVRLYNGMVADGLTHEYFGFDCTDEPDKAGKFKDVDFEILMSIRKKNLWPPNVFASQYEEDDLFDVIEFMYEYVSKPTKGWEHSHDNCGMHWEEFDKLQGQSDFRGRINQFLSHYERPFELSSEGMILRKVPAGYEAIYEAKVPTPDATSEARVRAATLLFRRHGSTLDDRRHAVSDLAGVLENLRPKLKGIITDKDEGDLFNIANNFLIRHHNDRQKSNYDAALWLSWMFYLYLSTIHLVLRKLEPTAR